MNKSKKLLLSAVFLAVVCAASVAVSFVLPQPAETTREDQISMPDSLVVPEAGASEDEDEVRIGPVAAPIQVSANDKNRKLTAEELEKYPQKTNIPTMYINLDDNMRVQRIQHSVFTGATYTIVDGENGIYEERLEIGGRGNYSWNMSEKKTYALALTEKADLLGMGAAKRWVLIANYNDRTQLRNYVGMTFSREIGMEYAPECKCIDLVINGDYRGTYLLVEKIQLHDQRVNVDPEIGGLFEIERTYRHGDCTWHISCPSGVHVMYKSPTADEIGSKLYQENFTKFKNIYIKADIAISKGYEYYSRYIDIDSFIDWYILNEFYKNYDSGFTTSCYSYIDEDGIIHMGPVWDYDTCMGNQNSATGIYPTGYHVADANETSWSAPWYVTLLQDEDFVRLLSERWTELVDNGMLDWFFNIWWEMSEVLTDSREANFERWPEAIYYSDRGNTLRTDSHEEEVEYVINFMSARYNWLCDQWYLGDDIPYRETNWEEWFTEKQNSRRRW